MSRCHYDYHVTGNGIGILGWSGPDVLILRPKPQSELVDLTRAIIGRWPKYPYYGGVYDNIEPHPSASARQKNSNRSPLL